jgi:hypothetical protein
VALAADEPDAQRATNSFTSSSVSSALPGSENRNNCQDVGENRK